VQNGTAYWHFTSKQALLEAMADALLAGVSSDLDPALPWQQRSVEAVSKRTTHGTRPELVGCLVGVGGARSRASGRTIGRPDRWVARRGRRG
jgi:AcrR family transcriptional regulator